MRAARAGSTGKVNSELGLTDRFSIGQQRIKRKEGQARQKAETGILEAYAEKRSVRGWEPQCVVPPESLWLPLPLTGGSSLPQWHGVPHTCTISHPCAFLSLPLGPEMSPTSIIQPSCKSQCRCPLFQAAFLIHAWTHLHSYPASSLGWGLGLAVSVLSLSPDSLPVRCSESVCRIL